MSGWTRRQSWPPTNSRRCFVPIPASAPRSLRILQQGQTSGVTGPETSSRTGFWRAQLGANLQLEIVNITTSWRPNDGDYRACQRATQAASSNLAASSIDGTLATL